MRMHPYGHLASLQKEEFSSNKLRTIQKIQIPISIVRHGRPCPSLPVWVEREMGDGVRIKGITPAFGGVIPFPEVLE